MRRPHTPQQPAALLEVAAFVTLLASMWGVVILTYAVQGGWIR